MTHSPTEKSTTQPKPLHQALADYRAEKDRQRKADEERREMEIAERESREAHMALQAADWIAERWNIDIPLDLLHCDEQSGRVYEVTIAGRIRFNGTLHLTASGVEVASRYMHLDSDTWHAHYKGAYIDADLLPALDYALPWPVDEGGDE